MTINMKKACAFVLALLAVITFQTRADAAVVLRDGKNWVQPLDSPGKTWNEIDALCTTSNLRVCTGALSGLTWATNEDVLSLFETYLPGQTPTTDTPFISGGTVEYLATASVASNSLFETNHPFGNAFFAFAADFQMITTVLNRDATRFELQGWTSDSFSSGQFVVGGIGSVFVDRESSGSCDFDPTQDFCAGVPDNDRIQFRVSSIGGPTSQEVASRGGWFFQTTPTLTVDEPSTLALTMLAFVVAGVGGVRRRFAKQI